MQLLSRLEYETRFADPSLLSGTGQAAVMMLEKEDCLLPARSRTAHKYTFGRALILAGSVGYSGAPVLAANACERSGAGLTTLMVPESIYEIAAIKCDGTVVIPLKATSSGCAAPSSLDRILHALEKADACVIGPGFGTGDETEEILHSVLCHARCPLILDADALTVFSRRSDFMTIAASPLILTPHEGEFHRLGGSTDSGRLSGASEWGLAHPDQILILKGYGTLICSREKLAVNPTGGPAMAKGGSGDVLCGILCALLAQKLEPYRAAKTAVYLHGLAGDIASDTLGEYSLTPSDLIAALPEAFRQVTESSSNTGKE